MEFKIFKEEIISKQSGYRVQYVELAGTKLEDLIIKPDTEKREMNHHVKDSFLKNSQS